jgi:hypothetical protein
MLENGASPYKYMYYSCLIVLLHQYITFIVFDSEKRIKKNGEKNQDRNVYAFKQRRSSFLASVLALHLSLFQSTG